MVKCFLGHLSCLLTDSQHTEFGADSYITKPTKSWRSCNSEAKFVYNVAKRVLMQLQPKIWKETSAGSYNLLNVKIIGLLFTTGNCYCLLTRLRKSIKVLVVSTCASPIGLSGLSQGNLYKNTKAGVDYIYQKCLSRSSQPDVDW